MEEVKPVLRLGKLQFTGLSLAELGAALVLAILSVIFLLSGFTDRSLTTDFNSALRLYYSNQLAQASQAIDDARKARPDYGPVQEMYAKFKIDTASLAAKDTTGLDEALEVLSHLKSTWTVEISAGVAHLKKYDFTGDKTQLDEAQKRLEEARNLAGDNPEPYIELGHLALRRNDRAAADGFFKKATEDGMGIPTMDGLVDLYLGRAAVFQLKGELPQARDEYRRAYTLCPRARLAVADYGYLWARLIGERENPSDDELKGLLTAAEQARATLGIGQGWSDEERTAYEQATYSFENSKMCQLARKQDLGTASYMTTYQALARPDDATPFLNAGYSAIKGLGNKPITSAEALYLAPMFTSALPRKYAQIHKVAILNNLACCMLVQGTVGADLVMEDALKAADALKEPPDWVLYRNKAVFLDRTLGKPKAEALGWYQKSYDLKKEQPDVKARIDALKLGQGAGS